MDLFYGPDSRSMNRFIDRLSQAWLYAFGGGGMCSPGERSPSPTSVYNIA